MKLASQTPAADLSAPIFTATLTEILQGIEDTQLQVRVQTASEYALVALQAIARIQLPQDAYEQGTHQHPQVQHRNLIPPLLSAIEAIHRLVAFLLTSFPARQESHGSSQSEADFELAFDLVDGPTGQNSGLASQASATTQKIMTPAQAAADAAHVFGGMLQRRVLQFGDRLEHAVRQQESWPLLAELDDYTHRLSKAVQGVLFGVLAVFSQTARREEIWPEYRSSVSSAVLLRSALSDLSFHVGKFNQALVKASEPEARALMVGLADRLSRFAARSEYRYLRAEDKRSMLDVRATLHQLREHPQSFSVASLRHAVEGFSKFLESMQAINHREVLILHDRQRLTEALAVLGEIEQMIVSQPDNACERMDYLLQMLAALQGRHPELDDARRQYLPVDSGELAVELGKWRKLLTNVAASVG